jgi:hypothetical protein
MRTGHEVVFEVRSAVADGQSQKWKKQVQRIIRQAMGLVEALTRVTARGRSTTGERQRVHQCRQVDEREVGAVV